MDKKDYGQKVFIDCGGRHCTLFWESPHTFEEIPSKDILTLQDRLSAGDSIVGEKCHFGDPMRGLSKAQYFEEEELIEWYQDCKKKEIELLFFSSTMTEKARRIFGLPKSDRNDLMAISRYIKKFTNYHLMKPRMDLTTPPVVEEGWEVKDELNTMLNVARLFDYENPDDKASQFLKEALPEIAQRVKSNTKDVFGLAEKKDGSMKVTGLKFPQLYTVWSALMNFDGTPRLREPTGRPAGWKHVKQHYLGSSPHHGNGGVARSNLNWHGMKNYISRRQGNKVLNKKGNKVVKKIEDFTDHDWQTFAIHRKEYRDAVRDMFQVMRKMVVGI